VKIKKCEDDIKTVPMIFFSAQPKYKILDKYIRSKIPTGSNWEGKWCNKRV